LYFRVGYNDHKEMLDFLAAGRTGFFGIVADPTLMDRHRELREQVLKHRLDVVLDPKTQQSATPGGFSEKLGELPWGVKRPHCPSDFEETSGRRLIAGLGDFVLEHGFTQVLAPTHLLTGARDKWFDLDIEVVHRLRNYLDRKGGGRVPIIYPLAISYAALRDADQRVSIIHGLESVPATQIWLRVDGVGSNSTATAVCNYLEAAADFQQVGIPLVADCVGGLFGLTQVAFGSVGGLAHGITLLERFDAGAWRRPSGGVGFQPTRRVYIPALDLLLPPKEADRLIRASNRTRAHFGCNDSNCCPRGVRDMIDKPAHHFLYQRVQQIMALSQIPEQLRPQTFLERYVRPATDHALVAANIHWEDESMSKKINAHRKRLDALRIALGERAGRVKARSAARLPETRVSREARP
jgi:hypothetical protein